MKAFFRSPHPSSLKLREGCINEMPDLAIAASSIAFGTTLLLGTISPALALTDTQVSQLARSITVRIDGQNPGTGVIVQRNQGSYIVLTAKHVIPSEDEYNIITSTGKSYLLNYQTVKKFEGVDLALLEFRSNETYPTAKVGNSDRLSEGMSLFVAGFPGKDSVITESVYNFSSGKLTAQASKPLKEGYSLVYTNRTLPGMSGGPVLDQQGQLIGIHGQGDGKSERLERLNETVFVKTGFNLGIPINRFMQLAGSTLAKANPVAGSGVSPVKNPLPSAPVAMWPKVIQPSASDSFLEAADLYRRGDYTAAQFACSQAIRLNPNFAAAYSLRGNILMALDSPVAAIADFSQALRLDPGLVPAYMGRGLAYSAQGDRASAVADYTQAIQRGFEYPLAYYNRGVVLLNQGQQAQAVQDLRMAADLSLRQGDREEYQRAMEALNIASKPCRQSIYTMCDR
jgi:serine protease Do